MKLNFEALGETMRPEALPSVGFYLSPEERNEIIGCALDSIRIEAGKLAAALAPPLPLPNDIRRARKCSEQLVSCFALLEDLGWELELAQGCSLRGERPEMRSSFQAWGLTDLLSRYERWVVGPEGRYRPRGHTPGAWGVWDALEHEWAITPHVSEYFSEDEARAMARELESGGTTVEARARVASTARLVRSARQPATPSRVALERHYRTLGILEEVLGIIEGEDVDSPQEG